MAGTQTVSTAYDPLGHHVEFPFRRQHYPLGYPLLIRTTHREVLEAAEESWSGIAPNERPAPDFECRFIVTPEGRAAGDQPPVYRSQVHLMTVVSDTWNTAVIDFARSVACCWASAATVARRSWFRYYFLEAMAYSMVTDACLTPVHAACVSLDGHGVLLCGDAGAGKSTLAFACARRGWTYITDDAAWLDRHAADRIVLGRPRQIRLRQSAAALFEELRNRPAFKNPGGKLTIEVATAEFPEIRTGSEAVADFVVFLDRQPGGRSQLVRIPTSEALQRLTAGLTPFGEHLAGRHASLRRLLDARPYLFRYENLDEAVDELERMVAGVR